ncbi:hypothetical protein JOB18_013161 [Solea senegalensis]|uniref:Uncharacterized protein n=1 Tax=Solea senegalensis TaxID=28829 RepID=A0AAV6R8J0_SOLSE|nr:hypothetical protein JOB18_013161 [Solea senegalensis]
MKRSQRFSSSFSFEEDQQPQPKTEDKEEDEELSSKNSNGVPVAELVETELAAECLRLETRDNFCDRNDTSSRQSNRELIYQLDLDQSEDTLSSLSCESPNESSSSTSPSDDRQVTSSQTSYRLGTGFTDLGERNVLDD